MIHHLPAGTIVLPCHFCLTVPAGHSGSRLYSTYPSAGWADSVLDIHLFLILLAAIKGTVEIVDTLTVVKTDST